ncbi:MAG: hypothetical protein IPG53_22505 [Ignavibacteriales bacterium]|nr:hypothetical protein [Ignavibacteriales bacterium]
MNQVLTSKDIQQLKDQVSQYLKKSDFKSARDAATKLLESFPNDPEANYIFALVCLENYEVSDALEYSNLAVKLNDKDPNSRFFAV